MTTYLTIDAILKIPQPKVLYTLVCGILSFFSSIFELRFHFFNKLGKLFFALLPRFGVHVSAYALAVYARRISTLIQMLVKLGYTARPRFADFGLVGLERRFFRRPRFTFRPRHLGVRTADTAVNFHRRLSAL